MLTCSALLTSSRSMPCWRQEIALSSTSTTDNGKTSYHDGRAPHHLVGATAECEVDPRWEMKMRPNTLTNHQKGGAPQWATAIKEEMSNHQFGWVLARTTAQCGEEKDNQKRRKKLSNHPRDGVPGGATA